MLLVIATICLTAAVTVAFAPATPNTLGSNLTPLWLLGVGAILAAVVVDTDTARNRLPFLRPAHIETQRELSAVSLEGQRLLGRLNAYAAREGDDVAEGFWRDQVQQWTDWLDRIVQWRLPHLRSAIANEADRDQAAFIGVSWQHHLQTWMQVRMKRINEMVLDADRLQHALGPKPSEDGQDGRRPPKWTDPPPPSGLDPREGARQQEVLRRIWAEYLASHDGISPTQIAGLEPLPKEFVESRLDQLGETWRRSEYWL
ncbi:MAG: hypothetical protein IVW53_01305 [Chloroflexi bacterium]|nr:hypothetical protein [Chloroflexota bacterium]